MASLHGAKSVLSSLSSPSGCFVPGHDDAAAGGRWISVGGRLGTYLISERLLLGSLSLDCFTSICADRPSLPSLLKVI